MSTQRGSHAGILIAVAALVVAACSGAAAPSPSTTADPTGTPVPTATPTTEPTPEPIVAAPSPTPGPTPFVDGTKAAPRTITVMMSDAFRFDPAAITVQSGETIRFVLVNTGVIPHDFTIGDAAAQQHHAEEMASGEMHHGGGEMNAVLVDPGTTAELVYQFGSPDAWLIGCHVPGHYDAGMHGTLTIVETMP